MSQMPVVMAPLKKPRHTPRLPLALNPLKSKDVLTVLAERNQTVVPVGAWVEPASTESSEIPAYTSACVIEEALKEQLRKKQETLKHFQKQVKHRVNQQVRLRKKQQLQRSHEAAEKEGLIAMQSSDPAHLTPKRRTSVFSNHLNTAIGSSCLYLFPEDEKNHNELFQQQAQALGQTMKQVRHQLASFRTTGGNKSSLFPSEVKESVPTQEKALSRKPAFIRINIEAREEIPFKTLQGLSTIAYDHSSMQNEKYESGKSLSIVTDERWTENVLWGDQQDLFSKIEDKPFIRVQKIKFKNPVFDVIEERELKQLQPPDILPEAQDYLQETQSDLLETRDGLPGVHSVEPDIQTIGLQVQAGNLETQASDLETQTGDPKAQDAEIETQVTLETQSTELENGRTVQETSDLLPPNPKFRSKDHSFLLKDQDILPEDQNILPKSEDQDFLPTDQKTNVKQPASILIDRREREVFSPDVHQDLPCRHQDQTSIRYKKVRFEEPYSDVTPERERADFSLSLYLKQQFNIGTVEREQDDHHHLQPRHHKEASSRSQVYDAYQSRLITEMQAPLVLQSGVDEEEEKKVRQKQYLRYKRLFMDIEREQVKEQRRQKEHKKKIEKIKNKKEEERYAEEQRILRMNCHAEPDLEEKMSEILAQLQLEEIKGEREKQQQRKREYVRYVEALRAQIQEKMQLNNINLPPLCCCGPEFWDAHPDTCANNCIFYKNHRAYTRALHSVISSCDIPEENSTLRNAIRNFASVYRRTLKNL
ncbi:coiled-coil domain-containing protein 15 isoform X3 [Tenrec ecaudatus]|uniref:coiled-coil domain-containing protein 15 isoform X3 n=1 Tax=Tenrec ecaudatus TaxID=94439 RepID=UPI003F599175